jgi:hypothetical protein
MEKDMESRTPSIIDLNAELAKLTMFRELTPTTTREERRGSATLLGPYRDGILFAGKNAGTSHWEDHAEDGYTFSTARRSWTSCAMTGRPSPSRFAPE